MNRIYNLIFSATKERWIVVSEKVKGNGKVPKSLLRSIAVLIAMLLAGEPLYGLSPGALPTGGQITAGKGTIASSGNLMTVNQSSQQLIASWNSFNIGQNAAVRFNQPNTAASALNRITDQNPTQIMGSLSSNGQVYLLNPSGIIFGKTAQVNVGVLLASSLTMFESDYLSGKYTFSTASNPGSIQNQGTINASNGGVVALIAPKVTNEGSISANNGSVLLTAGRQVTLDFTGDGLISYTVDQGAVDALAENDGLIKADGGQVVMTAKFADALRTATVTNTGVIEARTLQNKAGHILLLSDMKNGVTNVSGTLDASAPNCGDGGFIETSGGRVKIADATVVTTLAPQGKSGTWLLDPTNFTISSGSALQTTSGIGVTTLSTALGLNDVTIATSNTLTPSNLGDIKVNAAVSWSAHTLTLSAINNIYINANLNGSGTAALALNYGQGALAAGNTSTYTLTNGAQVNLPAGLNFSTKQGSNGTPKSFTVITSLGTAADAITGSGQTLQSMARSLSKNFVLGNNIDASATVLWNSIAGFTPIGNFNYPFTGSFDGLGHTITGLIINRSSTDNVGLFGYTSGAIIRNVGIVGGSVTGQNYVGGMVGISYGTTITNSFATGRVTGSGGYVGGLVGFSWGSIIPYCYSNGNVAGLGSYVGGLVGINNGTISNSFATGSVIGTADYVGGLVGYNDGGTITNSYCNGNISGSGGFVGGLGGGNNSTIANCYATGSVTGSNDVGGLMGINDGTITNSYSTASITGEANVGGLVGINNGSIANSYSTASITGAGNVGDLVGINNGSIVNSYALGKVTGNGDCVGGLVGLNSLGSIANSYATGSVTGTSRVGGLVGLNSRTITNSYATGSVTGTSYVGGLTGSDLWGAGITTDSFWNTTTSGQATSAGGTGKTVAQMMQLSTFTSWNIANTGGIGAVWRIYEGHTAPLLISFLKPLTLANVSKTYNMASQTGTVNGALSGQAAKGVNVGNYSNSYYSNQQGYDIIGGNLSITQKALTMSGLSIAASKVYDGTTKAVVIGTKTLAAAEAAGQGTATDGISYIGDIVSLIGTAVGTYNSKDVTTASKVIYSGLSLTGRDAHNYLLTIQSPASAKITPKTVTLKATKKYDGSTKLGIGTVTIGTGVTVNGKTESVGYGGATAYSQNTTDNNINYIKTITLLNGTNALAANYALPTLNHSNAPVTINK